MKIIYRQRVTWGRNFSTFAFFVNFLSEAFLQAVLSGILFIKLQISIAAVIAEVAPSSLLRWVIKFGVLEVLEIAELLTMPISLASSSAKRISGYRETYISLPYGNDVPNRSICGSSLGLFTANYKQ